MTIPMPPDGEYPLVHPYFVTDAENYGPDVVLTVAKGEAYLNYPGGYSDIATAEMALSAGRALLYWAAWKSEQDIIAWLAAEDQHRKDLRRLGLYNKGRIGRGA